MRKIRVMKKITGEQLLIFLNQYVRELEKIENLQKSSLPQAKEKATIISLSLSRKHTEIAELLCKRHGLFDRSRCIESAREVISFLIGLHKIKRIDLIEITKSKIIVYWEQLIFIKSNKKEMKYDIPIIDKIQYYYDGEIEINYDDICVEIKPKNPQEAPEWMKNFVKEYPNYLLVSCVSGSCHEKFAWFMIVKKEIFKNDENCIIYKP